MVLIYFVGMAVCVILLMAYQLNELFEKAGKDYEKVKNEDKANAVLSSLTLSLMWPLTLFVVAVMFISHYGGIGSMILFAKIRGGKNVADEHLEQA